VKNGRRIAGLLTAGALGTGLLTVTTPTAEAATTCSGGVDIYGVLDDGRLTFSQIKWGLNYIDGHYGSPCDAWNFWQANSWY
jgi:hypothetical protein